MIKTTQQFVVFESGDNVGSDVTCYDCGREFMESLPENWQIGDCIVCKCGGRCAYIIEPD